VCLGGFDNLRREFSWAPHGGPEGGRGFTLELDATTYPWGTLYELECETVGRPCVDACGVSNARIPIQKIKSGFGACMFV
jgi:hypothetical protein